MSQSNENQIPDEMLNAAIMSLIRRGIARPKATEIAPVVLEAVGLPALLAEIGRLRKQAAEPDYILSNP